MSQSERWRVTFYKRAKKDVVLLARAGLRAKSEALIEILRIDPFQSPPPFEKLTGELSGMFSRRISLQHRLVYIVIPELREVRVLRMWTHYE